MSADTTQLAAPWFDLPPGRANYNSQTGTGIVAVEPRAGQGGQPTYPDCRSSCEVVGAPKPAFSLAGAGARPPFLDEPRWT